MADFLLGLVFFIGLIIIITVLSSKKNNKETSFENSNQKNNTNTSNCYVKNEVFNFELKGIFYNDYKRTGDFLGFAKNTYNSHDKYSVGIFINNKLAGYPPKGNYRLHNTINQIHNNNLLCWGNIHYDEFRNQYSGTVNIPIGFTMEELEKTETALQLIFEQDILSKKENKSIEDFFKLLNNDSKIYELITNEKILKTINYYFNKNIIPQLSKRLEQEKDWENLIKLENYKLAINDLSENFKNSTLKRIEKAKSISNTQTD